MLKIGVIGLGRMGSMHIPFLNKHPEAQVVAAFDPNEATALACKETFQLELCASAEELVNRKDVDAVFIASPTYCHIEGLLPAFKAGKPVFCEKPLCRDMAQYKEIMDTAKACNAKVAIGFVRRYNLSQQKLHEITASGKLGTLRAANVDMTLGVFKRMPGDWFADFDLCGGVVLDMLSHHLDLLIWQLGDVKSVYANGLLESKDLPLPNDYCSATITFANGVICNVTCAWNRMGRSANYMEYHGDNGCASLTWGKPEVQVHLLGQEKETVTVEDDVNSYLREDTCWIDSILNGTDAPVTLEDGAKAFQLASDILTSVQTGDVIKR